MANTAPAGKPMAPAPYKSPFATAWQNPAEMQAALYHNDPLRPRPSAGTPNLSPPEKGASGVLTVEGYIQTNW